MNKIEEMNQVQKAMSNVKKIVSNFTSYFESKIYFKIEIMCYNREISESIFLLFNNNKEYKEFANILTSVHVDNNKLFQSIVIRNLLQIDEISFLTKETQDWDNYYSSVKVKRSIIQILVQEREESRKVYDHYEKKLEKLEDKKDQKIREGSYIEGSDFYTIITRNETKYINAKDDYVKKAICAYDTIDKLNNNRFNIVTPVLLNVNVVLFRCFLQK